MALFSLTPLYLRMQRILSWFFAALFALTVFGAVDTVMPKKKGQDAAYSDTATGKVVLVRSRSKKRCRGVVATLVLSIAFGFTTIGFVLWKCRYDNRSVLWIQPYLQNGNSNSNLKQEDHVLDVDESYEFLFRTFFPNASSNHILIWDAPSYQSPPRDKWDLAQVHLCSLSFLLLLQILQ